jgi:hydroxyethylthiazole kinase-like uncharacterized protein yjeF
MTFDESPTESDALPVWTAREAAEYIRVPTVRDDKYAFGVLGVVTGSKLYPGAAVLGVEAAHRTGVGMVRYLGPGSAQRLVLARRPEVVTVPGQVQAWLVGSGMDARERTAPEEFRLTQALASGCPVVVDAGALDLAGAATGPLVLTPHARELASLLETDPEERPALLAEIAAHPARWAQTAADTFGATVVLKGHETHVVCPRAHDGSRFHVRILAPTTWLATAGSGDVLAGVIGAFLATHADALAENPQLMGPLCASAAFLHGYAAQRTSAGGPIAALDVAEAIPAAIASLLP